MAWHSECHIEILAISHDKTSQIITSDDKRRSVNYPKQDQCVWHLAEIKQIRIASWWISSRTPSTKSSLVQWTVLMTKSWRKECILRKWDKPLYTGMILCTLQETNISQNGHWKIIFKIAFGRGYVGSQERNSSTQDRQAMDTVWWFGWFFAFLQVADGEDLSPRVAKRRLQGSPEKGTIGKGTAVFHQKGTIYTHQLILWVKHLVDSFVSTAPFLVNLDSPYKCPLGRSLTCLHLQG